MALSVGPRGKRTRQRRVLRSPSSGVFQRCLPVGHRRPHQPQDPGKAQAAMNRPVLTRLRSSPRARPWPSPTSKRSLRPQSALLLEVGLRLPHTCVPAFLNEPPPLVASLSVHFRDVCQEPHQSGGPHDENGPRWPRTAWSTAEQHEPRSLGVRRGPQSLPDQHPSQIRASLGKALPEQKQNILNATEAGGEALA